MLQFRDTGEVYLKHAMGHIWRLLYPRMESMAASEWRSYWELVMGKFNGFFTDEGRRRWAEAAGAEAMALVQEDRLVAKSEEAVFRWVKRWWEAGARPEAELLAVLRHVRFAAMAEGFLRETVRAWPPMGSVGASVMLLNAVLPLVGVTKPMPRVRPGSLRSAGTKQSSMEPILPKS